MTAQSTVEVGGPGGNCTVDGPPSMSVFSPEPGVGGGVPGGPRARARVGAASGASAFVSGGGPGGSGIVRGAAILSGDGGDGADAQAQSSTGTDTRPGKLHAGRTPGGSTHAAH